MNSGHCNLALASRRKSHETPLTQDKLERVLEALVLSRRCRAIIRQNVAISLGVVVLLAISALGSWIPLPLGVLGKVELEGAPRG